LRHSQGFCWDSAQDLNKFEGLWIDYGKDNYAGVTWSNIPDADGRNGLFWNQ
jgi:sucrose-6-phosphate hydrolase SacC (GH32 family)